MSVPGLALLLSASLSSLVSCQAPADVDFSQASLDPATGLVCVHNQGNLQLIVWWGAATRDL